MRKTVRISQKEWGIAGLIFGLSVIFYGGIAARMGSIIFYPTDETRFIALAKSLHFVGNISEQYVIKNYDDILYPFLLSLGYFFYSPQYILIIFRYMGVIMMASASFPIYFLASKIRIGKIFNVDGAIFVTVVSMLIPEMTYTAYISAEVLLYPLFMWMMYMAYLEFTNRDSLSRINFLMIMLLFAIYATKTFAIIFATSYCLTIFILGILDHDKKLVLKAILSGIIFMAMVVGLKGILFCLNGMKYGTSHYDQVVAIFPFTFQVFISLVRGLLYYVGWFILFTGIVPVMVLCCNFNYMEKKEIPWIINLIISSICTILEIVVIIHYAEEGTNSLVARFHYRYLFYFFVPMLIVLVKYNDVKNKKIAYGICGFEIVVLNLFFRVTNQQGQGICDGIMCLFFRKANDYQGGTDTVYAILMLLIIWILFMLIYNKANMIINGFIIATIGLIIVIMPFSLKLPIEQSAANARYIDDYLKIAGYINESAEKVVCMSAGDYSDAVFRTPAYSKKDFIEVFLMKDEEKIEIDNNRTIIIMSKGFPYRLKGPVDEINIGTENISVYSAQQGILLIDKNAYNIDFLSYNYVKDGYDESGKRYLMPGGISFGPYIDLTGGHYQIEIKGENLMESDITAYSYSESKDFELIVLKETDSQIVFEMDLLRDVSSFEVSVRNVGGNIVVIDNIKIEKVKE